MCILMICLSSCSAKQLLATLVSGSNILRHCEDLTDPWQSQIWILCFHFFRKSGVKLFCREQRSEISGQSERGTRPPPTHGRLPPARSSLDFSRPLFQMQKLGLSFL